MEYDFVNSNGGPFSGNVTTSVSGRTRETPITPRFSVEYAPSDKLMLYGSAAKGFRPGGANPLVNTVTCGTDLENIGLSQVPTQYKSDTVWSYEVGAKGRVGRALTFSGSVFNIEWSDIQQPRTLPTCAAVFIDNLGKARSRGFDAAISLVPTRGLTLDVGVGYMDVTQRQTISTEPGATTPGTVTRRGDRFAIPWIVTLSADYETALGSDALTGYGRVQYDYKAGYDTASRNVGYNPAEGRIDSQNFVSARLGLRRDALDLSFFVNNLLNSRSILGQRNFLNPITNLPSNRQLQTTFRPRTFGATASYRF